MPARERKGTCVARWKDEGERDRRWVVRGTEIVVDMVGCGERRGGVGGWVYFIILRDEAGVLDFKYLMKGTRG